MYDALDIAEYIIWYCESKGKPISNLKLQKILYFVQAEFLVARGVPCFENKIEAWDYGPVVPDVYHEYKIFGSNAIFSFSNMTLEILPQDKRTINIMVDECNRYSSTDLVDITHRQLPWLEARKRGYNAEITKESIKDFFEEK